MIILRAHTDTQCGKNALLLEQVARIFATSL